LAAGADSQSIIKNTLSTKSVSTLRLWGKALSQLKTNEKLGIVSTIITKGDIIESEADYSDLDGISNFLNSVPSANVSMVLSERENEIKGSFRTLSKDVNVAKLAKLFGGGGHKKAAGFSIPGRLVKEAGRWRII
jgi:phosphoesterase RecJ-like protein